MRKPTVGIALATTLLLLLLPAAASAEPATVAQLRDYAKRASVRCPDSVVTLKPVSGRGPANFTAFEYTATSADESCKGHKFLLYSPNSQQIIMGMAFPLAQDGRPVNSRLEQVARELTKSDVTTSVSPFPLPDGLKPATITRQTEYGPFTYNGYIDASDAYLIIGTRGSLRTDPRKTLREVLNVDKLAVRRGNRKAKVEIIELSDFECPTCGNMHKKIEPLLEKYGSKVNFGRIDFPLFEHHEWAMAAALGAHAIQKVAPAKYWDYVDFVFKNQEMIGKQPFDKVLQNFCEDHDIPWAKVVPLYRSPAERQAILNSVADAFVAGLNSTPTFLIDGQVVGFGPEGATMLAAIKSAMGVK